MRTSEYMAWQNMKSRCLHPYNRDYKDYGGRGILIYEEWVNSFDAFLRYMGPKLSNKLSLERFDNTQGYFPGNCYWAPKYDQVNNTRSNKLLTYNNRIQTMIQWSNELQIPYQTLKTRIRRGWSTERALAT